MIGDGAPDRPAAQATEPVRRRSGPRAVMDWPRFVRAWAWAYDGFDLRHAGPLARWWVRMAYTCGVRLTRMGASAAALTATALLAAVSVPVLATSGGRWALVAAVSVVIGIFAEATGRAVSVLVRRAARREAFYRSLAERVGEVCWLLAAAQLRAAPVVVLSCLALMAAHEYVRARATVGGMRPAGTTTVGDRPLRIVSTMAFLVIAGLAGGTHADLAAGTTTLVLALWAMLALFGFVQLLSIVRKALVS